MSAGHTFLSPCGTTPHTISCLSFPLLPFLFFPLQQTRTPSTPSLLPSLFTRIHTTSALSRLTPGRDMDRFDVIQFADLSGPDGGEWIRIGGGSFGVVFKVSSERTCWVWGWSWGWRGHA